MSWQHISLIVILVIGALVNVAMIGRERKPTEPGQAVVGLLLNAGLIVLIVTGQ